jgi:hypothetical protein
VSFTAITTNIGGDISLTARQVGMAMIQLRPTFFSPKIFSPSMVIHFTQGTGVNRSAEITSVIDALNL